MNANPIHIAVVGSGLSGLACADVLQDEGYRVTLFDKGRGPGGRMSTRRHGEYSFDHGAQYFTVRDSRFAKRIGPFMRDGRVAKWEVNLGLYEDGVAEPAGGTTTRYVGVPGMNQVIAAFAEDNEVHYSTAVTRIDRTDEGWALLSREQTLGTFDWVIVAIPAPQAAELIGDLSPISQTAGAVEMAPCWSAMAAFDGRLAAPYDGMFVNGRPISWISRNGAKPGRDSRHDCWVMHTRHEWSREHLDVPREEMAQILLDDFRAIIGPAFREPVFKIAHRWLYAFPDTPAEPDFLLDKSARIAACGDWCGGPRVEGAFLSGYKLGRAILAELETTVL